MSATGTPPPAPVLALAYSTSLTAPFATVRMTGTSSVTQTAVNNFPTAGFTTSVWMQSSAANGIILRYAPPGGGAALSISNPGNIQISLGTATTGPTGISFNDGLWHQLAVTFVHYDINHYSVNIYKDAMPVYAAVGQLTCLPAGLASGGGLALGDGTTGFTGNMSEFRLWSAPLTEDQIATNMQRRLSSSTPGILIWWGLSSSADSGTLTNCTFSAPVVQFRTIDPGNSAYLNASWNSVAGANTYDFQTVTNDGSVVVDTPGLPATPTSTTIGTLLLNHIYSARVRGVSSSDGPGPWSAVAQLAPLDLPQQGITSAWDTSTNKLTASWAATDQTQQYQPFINGTASGAPQSTTTFDLTPSLSAAGAVTFQLRGRSGGSTGPLSAVADATAPTGLTIVYDPVAQNLTAGFNGSTAVTGYWLQIVPASGPAFYTGWVSAGASHSVVIPAASINIGTTYTYSVRCINCGSIGAWVSIPFGPQNIVAPALDPLTQDVVNKTVTATWQFNETPYASVSYSIVLSANGTPQPPVNVQGQKAHTFTGLTSGVTYGVQVRAVTTNNLSQWSQTQSIVLGSDLAAVNLASATSDNSGNITLTWSAVTGAGNYVANIYASGGFNYTSAAISGSLTTTTLNKSTTGVTVGNTYSVRMKATASSSPDGPWGNALTVKAGTTPTPDPTPTPPDSNSNADPVYASNGSFAYGFVAVQVQGVELLQFTPLFSIIFPLPTDNPSWPDKPIGARWTHNYNTFIKKLSDSGQVAVYMGAGATSVYTVPPSIVGQYTKTGVPNGDSLTLGSDLNYRLTTADQTVYLFNNDGVLQTITSPRGNNTGFSYTNGLLTNVRDAVSGRSLTITYYPSGDNAGRIQTVSASSGVTASFNYAGGNLTTFTDVNGNNTTFTYYSNALIDTITGPDQKPLLKNTYDPATNRVLSQKDGRALATGAAYATTFTYTDVTYNGVSALKTTVVDRNGNTSYSISAKESQTTLYTRIDLGGGNIQATYKSYNANLQLSNETVYEGPAIPDTQVQGNTTSYTYTGAGLVQTCTRADGKMETYAYDGHNNLTSATDIYGNVTRNEYYPNNTLKTVTDPAGRTTNYTYQPGGFGGQLQNITDVLGNSWSYSYWPSGDLKTITDPSGNIITRNYDGLGRLTGITATDAASRQIYKATNILYPASGLIQTQQTWYDNQPAASPYSISYTYTAPGMPWTVTDTQNNTTTYAYDANYNLTTLTYQPSGGISDVEALAYDHEDRLITQTYTSNASGAQPVYSQGYGYDNAGRTISTTDGNNNQFTFQYAMQNPTAPGAHNQTVTTTSPPVTVPDGHGGTINVTYSYTDIYDVHGRQVSYGYPTQTGTATIAQSVAYNSPGTAGSVLECITTYPPAAAGQSSYTTAARYDALFRTIGYTDQMGNVWSTTYTIQPDTAGAPRRSLVTTTDPTQRVTQSWYDLAGNLIRRAKGAAPVQQTAAYVYDALARINSVTQFNNGTPLSTTFTYSYDQTLNASAKTVNAYGQPLSTLYFNGSGQVIRETYASGNPVQYQYNERGMLKTFINGASQSAGYTYDHAARLTGIQLPSSPLVTQVLDGCGNQRQTKVGDTVSISRTFDQLNRIVSRTDPFGNVVQHSYTPFNEPDTVTYPDGKKVQYAYDGLCRMKSVTDWAQRATTYTYYPTGMLSSIALPGGINMAYGFDGAGRLSSLRAANGPGLIASGTYTYDAAGNPAAATELRPLPPQRSAPAASFTSSGYTLSKVGTQSVSYDPDQNMTGIPGMEGALANNALSQLISTGSGAITFQYDMDGNRIGMTAGAQATRFVQDPMHYFSTAMELPYRSDYLASLAMITDPNGITYGQPVGSSSNGMPSLNRILLETDGGNSASMRYVYGMGLVSQEAANGTYRTFIPAAGGNVAALADASGNVTDRYAYGPFGENGITVGTTPNRFRFGGIMGVADDGNGLLYMRGRYYRPAIYRFTARDPLVGSGFNPQTLNRYAYANGNPLRNADPSGLWLGAFGDFVDSVTSGIANGVGRIIAKIAVVGAAVVGTAALLGTAGAYLAGLFGGLVAGGGISASMPASAFQPAAGNILTRVPTNLFRNGFQRGFRWRNPRQFEYFQNIAESKGNGVELEQLNQSESFVERQVSQGTTYRRGYNPIPTEDS